jgi:hypothetical protein
VIKILQQKNQTKKMTLYTVADEAEDRAVVAASVSAAVEKDAAEVLEEDTDMDVVMASVEDSMTILPKIQVKMMKNDNRISS